MSDFPPAAQIGCGNIRFQSSHLFSWINLKLCETKNTRDNCTVQEKETPRHSNPNISHNHHLRTVPKMSMQLQSKPELWHAIRPHDKGRRCCIQEKILWHLTETLHPSWSKAKRNQHRYIQPSSNWAMPCPNLPINYSIPWQTWHCKAQSAPDYNQKHTFLPPPRGYVLRCVCMSARACKDTENGKWKGRLGKERSTNRWKPSWVAWLKEISSTVADTQTLERITRISKSDSECTTVYVGLSIAANTAVVVITIKIMNLSHPLATTSMASSGLLSAQIP
jgi:hypothetical protein